MDDQELQALLKELQTGDTRQRREASLKLRNAANASTLPALTRAFHDSDNWVRRYGFEALRNIGSKEALDFLESNGVRLMHLAGDPGQRVVAETFQGRMLAMGFRGGLIGAIAASLIGVGLAYFPYATCDEAWYYVTLSLQCPPTGGTASWYWMSVVPGFIGGIIAGSISAVLVGEITSSAFPHAKDPYRLIARTALIASIIFSGVGAFIASFMFFVLGFV